MVYNAEIVTKYFFFLPVSVLDKMSNDIFSIQTKHFSLEEKKNKIHFVSHELSEKKKKNAF